MNYEKKYLKYKQKYLELKNGGFIKGIDKIEEIYDASNYKLFLERLDNYMPLCSFDNTKTNFILINDENYTLINKKLDESFKLYKLNDKFDIEEIAKPQLMINDDVIIPGINKMISGIHLIQAYQYYNNDIFRDFLEKIPKTAYKFFNKLVNIMYFSLNEKVLYQNNINILLSIIFINKLDYVISLLHNLHILLDEDKTNYYTYTPGKKIKYFNNNRNIEKGILIDYFSNYVQIIMSDSNLTEYKDFKKIDSFEKLKNHLNIVLSKIDELEFEKPEQSIEFNIIMKIINIIYKLVDSEPSLVDRYNYSEFINKYRLFIQSDPAIDLNKFNQNYKGVKKFINEYDYTAIKNTFIINFSCLIYLCYKTNSELGEEYKASQYILLDYFFGITKVNNNCIPINKRQVILKLLNIKESPDLKEDNVKNPLEIQYYETYKQIFRQISQYTFRDPPKKHTDCGETMLLNTFNYLLLKEDGTFNLTDIDSWDIKLKEFYLRYPNMESMLKVPISVLKTDLFTVFNNRDTRNIKYNKYGDINTTMESIINTCCFILNIETDNFKNIFKKLNSAINEADIIIDGSTYLNYGNHFTLKFDDGHGDFKLKFLDINIPDIPNKLSDHWINLKTLDNIPPNNYSFEHFKYLFHNNLDFFSEILPIEAQTEKICIEAVNPSIIFLGLSNRGISNQNFEKVVNKTDKIYKAFVSAHFSNLFEIPKECLNSELNNIAFNQMIPYSYRIIKNIPKEFQEKQMIDKIKALDDEKLKQELIPFVRHDLL